MMYIILDTMAYLSTCSMCQIHHFGTSIHIKSILIKCSQMYNVHYLFEELSGFKPICKNPIACACIIEQFRFIPLCNRRSAWWILLAYSFFFISWFYLHMHSLNDTICDSPVKRHHPCACKQYHISNSIIIWIQVIVYSLLCM